MDNYTNEYVIFQSNAKEEIVLLFHKDKLNVDQIARVFKVLYELRLATLQNYLLNKHIKVIEQIKDMNIELDLPEDAKQQANSIYGKWLKRIFEGDT